MRVIKKEPDPKVEKEIICRRGCGATIGYLPNDVCIRATMHQGDSGGVEFINCPNCGKEITIRSW